VSIQPDGQHAAAERLKASMEQDAAAPVQRDSRIQLIWDNGKWLILTVCIAFVFMMLIAGAASGDWSHLVWVPFLFLGLIAAVILYFGAISLLAVTGSHIGNSPLGKVIFFFGFWFMLNAVLAYFEVPFRVAPRFLMPFFR
jgi:hypothetical protein